MDVLKSNMCRPEKPISLCNCMNKNIRENRETVLFSKKGEMDIIHFSKKIRGIRQGNLIKLGAKYEYSSHIGFN